MDTVEAQATIQEDKDMMPRIPRLKSGQRKGFRKGFPMPNGGKGTKQKIKVTGEPIPFMVKCSGCNEWSLMPDFDKDNPPEGWMCTYCKQKHKMKFNKNIHKWEFTVVHDDPKPEVA